jgi:hypothetical protein
MKSLLIYIVVLLFAVLTGYSQEILLDHKFKPGKSKTIRLDQPLMVRTFEGVKAKGPAAVTDTGTLVIEGKKLKPEDIMMISGFVERNPKEKAVGVGLTIGAGVILLPALYYILGGIAWGLPNGIFVGMTVLVFDLLIAYAGTNLMGIYPRRFSTMNWNILLSAGESGNSVPAPIPLPPPGD